jgi:hypothetical protein
MCLFHTSGSGSSLVRPAVALKNNKSVTIDRSPCCFHRPESQARRNPLLDKAMVLLNHIIWIGRCSATTAPAEFAGMLQFGDGAGIRWISIDVDHMRPDPAACG